MLVHVQPRLARPRRTAGHLFRNFWTLQNWHVNIRDVLLLRYSRMQPVCGGVPRAGCFCFRSISPNSLDARTGQRVLVAVGVLFAAPAQSASAATVLAAIRNRETASQRPVPCGSGRRFKRCCRNTGYFWRQRSQL